MSCGVGRRRGSDLSLLWLWRRPAYSSDLTLAWEPPCAAGAAPEKAKRPKKKRKRKKRKKYVFHTYIRSLVVYNVL